MLRLVTANSGGSLSDVELSDAAGTDTGFQNRQIMPVDELTQEGTKIVLKVLSQNEFMLTRSMVLIDFKTYQAS